MLRLEFDMESNGYAKVSVFDCGEFVGIMQVKFDHGKSPKEIVYDNSTDGLLNEIGKNVLSDILDLFPSYVLVFVGFLHPEEEKWKVDLTSMYPSRVGNPVSVSSQSSVELGDEASGV